MREVGEGKDLEIALYCNKDSSASSAVNDFDTRPTYFELDRSSAPVRSRCAVSVSSATQICRSCMVNCSFMPRFAIPANDDRACAGSAITVRFPKRSRF